MLRPPGPAANSQPGGHTYESNPITPEYLDTRSAAAYIGMSVQYLEIGRVHGYGPKFVKLGRAVRYRRAELDSFMQRHERDRTVGTKDVVRQDGAAL